MPGLRRRTRSTPAAGHDGASVCAFVMVIHLASYVPKLPRMLWGRAGYARNLLAARATRWLLLCGSLAAGLGLAFATYHLAGRWGGSGSIFP